MNLQYIYYFTLLWNLCLAFPGFATYMYHLAINCCTAVFCLPVFLCDSSKAHICFLRTCLVSGR